MRVTLNVTESHIARGVRGDVSLCPIALSAAEAWEIPSDLIAVNQAAVLVWNGDPLRSSVVARAETPDEAHSFINDFDHGVPVDPCQITLDFAVEEPRYRFTAEAAAV